MKRHTMQEIADFFGCYVVKDINGDAWMFTQKPKLYKDGLWRLSQKDNSCLLEYSDDEGNYRKCIPTDIITHNYKVLVVPKKIIDIDLQKNDNLEKRVSEIENELKKLKREKKQCTYKNTNNKNDTDKWYTLKELSELTGYAYCGLKVPQTSALKRLDIDWAKESKCLDKYHTLYSDKVLQALKDRREKYKKWRR